MRTILLLPPHRAAPRSPKFASSSRLIGSSPRHFDRCCSTPAGTSRPTMASATSFYDFKVLDSTFCLLPGKIPPPGVKNPSQKFPGQTC
jgi:hypothetical protein